MTLSKEEELLQDNKWIVSNLGKYLEPGKKRELILRWEDNLERLHELGIYDQPITTICGYVRNQLKEAGHIHALPYVNEVTPFKYKEMKYSPYSSQEDDEASDILTSDSSESEEAKILLAQDCKKINSHYILRLERTIKLLNEVKKSLETDTALEPEIPEIELEEYFVRWDGALDRTQEVLDGRQQVLPSTQHMLFYALSQATLNNAYSNYVRFMREFASITAKQSGKILRGHVTKLLLLYEPKNQNEAIYNGFYGTQCEDCGTWRVEYKYNSDKSRFMLFCYAKGHWNEAKTKELMK